MKTMMPSRTVQKRTVLSGIGCLSPMGENPNACSANMIAASLKGGLGPYLSYDFGESPVGLIPDVYFDERLDEREKMKYDRVSLMVSCVVGQCLRSAGLTQDAAELADTGIITGSGFGCMGSTNEYIRTLYKEGPALLDPMKFPLTSHNYPASISAIRYGLKGPITSIVASTGSSFNALLFANYLLKKGQAKRIIVVGFEEITELLYSLLDKRGVFMNGNVTAVHATDQRGENCATIPFEGCSGVVLEEYEAARERNAPLYGEITGWASAYKPPKAPLDGRILDVMMQTLKKTGEKPLPIDVLVLNRSGNVDDDGAESAAVAAANASGYSFSSQWALKSTIGNYLGASGLMEMVVALKKINNDSAASVRTGASKAAARTNRDDTRSLMINNFGSGSNIISVLLNTHAPVPCMSGK